MHIDGIEMILIDTYIKNVYICMYIYLPKDIQKWLECINQMSIRMDKFSQPMNA